MAGVCARPLSRASATLVNTNGAAATGFVLAANNADTPAFSTLFTYNKTTCVLSNPIQTVFDPPTVLPGGHTNTNGIEQPVWEPITGAFYVTLPEIDAVAPLAGGAGITGAVAKVDTTGAIVAIYPINYCQPAGLTVGPNGDLLVGCNSVFDDSGKKCSSVVPSPIPVVTPPATTAAAHPALCGTRAVPQSAICNPGRGCTPANGSLVSVPGAGGGDEVYFNAADKNYYVTAGNNPLGPTLAVISSTTDTLIQNVPTLPPDPAAPGVHGAGTVHSVAAGGGNGRVYVPLPSNTAYPNCTQGCVAVFSAQ